MSQVFISLSKVASQLLFNVLAKLSTQVKVYGFKPILIHIQICIVTVGSKRLKLLDKKFFFVFIQLNELFSVLTRHCRDDKSIN